MMNNKTANIEKVIYWDMDGTIADLYNQPNWLADIRAERPTFRNLPLMPNLDKELIHRQLIALQKKGWRIAVITWTPMDCTDWYHDFTSQEKIEWIEEHFPMVQEIHPLRYGTDKNVATNPNALNIIFDDNKEVRDIWKGIAFDENDIHTKLENLLMLPL